MSEYVGLPYSKGSDTSKAAAKSMVEPAKNQRYVIWDLIHRCAYGATCQEIEKHLGICHQSCSTRLLELRQMGRLKYNGKKRKTDANREACVHVAVEPQDWTDKRAGWPTPKKKSGIDEVAMWKKRAYEQLAIVNAYKAKYGKLED